jgi:hypothetical protein
VLSPTNYLLFVGVITNKPKLTLCWCYLLLFVGVITNKLLFFSVITNKSTNKCINFNVKRFAQGIGADILFMA